MKPILERNFPRDLQTRETVKWIKDHRYHGYAASKSQIELVNKKCTKLFFDPICRSPKLNRHMEKNSVKEPGFFHVNG